MNLIRPKTVAQKLAVSTRTVWYKVDTDPAFPRPVQVGPHTTAFVESEIDAWLRERMERRATERAGGNPVNRRQSAEAEA